MVFDDYEEVCLDDISCNVESFVIVDNDDVYNAMMMKPTVADKWD